MLDLRLALPDDLTHLAVGTQPVKVRCPDAIHKARTGGKLDKERSLAVYPDHLHCFGCGFHRNDAVEALAVLLGVDYHKAQQLAAQYSSEALDAYRERAATEARRDPLPRALAAAYADLLQHGPRAHRRDWLAARGLDEKTITDFQLGHDGFRFVIPVFDRLGQLLTLRYRRDDAYQSEQRPKYSGLAGRNGFYLYPEWRLAGQNWTGTPWEGSVVVCEGELDAVRCWQQGWPAVSATNGARQVPKVIAALGALMPHLSRVVLATDQDEPGEEAAYVAGREAEAAGLRVVRLRWDGAKDITDALQLGCELRRAGHADRAPAAASVPAGHAA